MEALERRTGRRGPGHPDDEDEDDAATLVGSRRGAGALAEDNVVFEIGDEDAHASDVDDDDDPDKRATPRGVEHERLGLIGGRQQRLKDRDD